MGVVLAALVIGVALFFVLQPR